MAVDLLLDHGAVGRRGASAVTHGVAERRLDAAARLLSKLDALPPVAPSADLVARTLARAASTHVVVPTAPSVAAMHLSH